MDYDALSELLFPDIERDIEYYENKYPPRNLKEGAAVTRFSPSPTGFLHIGGLFGALTDVLTAKSTGGVTYLRIEDTDKKREVEGGAEGIINSLSDFGITFDEGYFGTFQKGDYGPYIQSERVEIYKAVAKDLVKKGLAYPCFCSEEDLSGLRKRQEEAKEDITGYYGKYAKCRNLTFDEIKDNVKNGKSYVLRFKSDGKADGKIIFNDIIRGRIETPENTIDEVLLKSNGVPTYHFAHVVDDHFMRTTHVIRGEEWLSSVPKHMALFKACGFKPPKYAHTPVIMKIDEETLGKRKFSKRKDPEAAAGYFKEEGYPKESLLEYLLTLLNSDFEDWRRANPDASIYSFPFKLKKMSPSGCLFDINKLNDVSKNVISRMTADYIYENVLNWAKVYDRELYALFTKDPDYAKNILDIDRGGKKPRKDISRWTEVKEYLSYFYDEIYKADFSVPENLNPGDCSEILRAYVKIYDENDGKDEWFEKIKSICPGLGFTPNVKEYKNNPEKYKGHVGDVSGVIRLAATSRANTPDLYMILKLLGKERFKKRVNESISALKG